MAGWNNNGTRGSRRKEKKKEKDIEGPRASTDTDRQDDI